MCHAPRKTCIDLGLDLSARTLKPGQTRSRKELAIFCGCNEQTIKNIEDGALEKIRREIKRRMLFNGDPLEKTSIPFLNCLKS